MMTRYRQKSIEDEGIDNYLNRTAFEHGGVDFDLFKGFVDRKVNVANLMKAMDVKTRDTINKYIVLYENWKKRQAKRRAEHDKAVDELNDV